MSPVDAATQEVWRLFVAVDLPGDVRERIRDIRNTLKTAGWHGRWTNPESTHLTLKFFGNQPAATVGNLARELHTAVRGERPFTIRTGEMGAFPNVHRPRVIWLGVNDPGTRLTRLARSIDERSQTLGIEPEERSFSPHLTVARVRPEDRETITDIERHFDVQNGRGALQFEVEHITLYRSELRRSGAIYTVVERIDFEAP